MKAKIIVFVWLLSTILFFAGLIHSYNTYEPEKMVFNDGGYNFTVYQFMPEDELSEKLDHNFSDSTAGITDNEGRIWLEVSAAANRTHFHNLCDHEVLHNRYPFMDHELVYSISREVDFDVCDRVVSRVDSKGWI